MLNNIIQAALRNRLIVVITSVLLLLIGGYTASRMEVDVFPDLTAPTVVVITEAHGMAPEEAERLVTFPVETAVNGATDVRRVRSASSAGLSIVWVEFEWGTDIFRARQIVTERLVPIAERLPHGTGTPTLAPQASIMGEIMLLSLTADSTSLMDLRSIADWQIRPSLLAIAGVANVITIGGEYKQYQILISPQKLMHHGVTLGQVLDAAAASNVNASGGFMQQHAQEYIIRGQGRTERLSDLGRTVVAMHQGSPVLLADVAEIRIGAADKIGDGSLRGEPAVIMTVSKQPSTNTLDLTARIDTNLAELRKQLPPDVHVGTRIFRQADFIEASISNIERTLLEGSLFVVIVLFLFLMNARATVISLLAIPLSLVVALFTLQWMGYSINTMSLGGMAIAIGALVDDAIIDVENVLKRLRANVLLPREQRRPVLTVIFDASVEIRTSIINATLIIVVAFLPLFFLSGMEGRLLYPLGVAFVVSLFASLIVSITVTPVLCSILLTGEKQLTRQAHGSWLVQRLNSLYRDALERIMRAGMGTLVVAVGLMVIATVLFTGLGRSFLPEFNEGSLVISAVSLPGISLSESNVIGSRVEKALLEVPGVLTTTRRTGRAEKDEHAQGVNSSEIDVPFDLQGRTRDAFMAEIRNELAGVTEANITVGQPIGHRIDHMLSGTRANIAIKLFGPDLPTLFQLSNSIKGSIADVPGLVDLSVEQQIDIPQIQIRPRRDIMAHHGLSIGELMKFIDVAFAGERVGEVYEGVRNHDLIVRFDEANRGSIEKIRNALIELPDGHRVPLSEVADVVSASGPNTINRENVQRKTVVSVNVAGRDQQSAVAEIKARISDSVALPEGYRIEYGGQFEAEEEASRTLLLTSALSMLIIFLLLYQEFKELKLAAIILINLPLALIGGIFSIWITDGIISIPSIIGFITLFGVATRNGILLVSHYEHLKKEGTALRERIIHGSVDRLSPILMTALTAGLALIPLALAGDLPGNEIQSPMAKVILGGLFSSTLLNIFIVPVVYYFAERRSKIA